MLASLLLSLALGRPALANEAAIYDRVEASLLGPYHLDADGRRIYGTEALNARRPPLVDRGDLPDLNQDFFLKRAVERLSRLPYNELGKMASVTLDRRKMAAEMANELSLSEVHFPIALPLNDDVEADLVLNSFCFAAASLLSSFRIPPEAVDHLPVYSYGILAALDKILSFPNFEMRLMATSPLQSALEVVLNSFPDDPTLVRDNISLKALARVRSMLTLDVIQIPVSKEAATQIRSRRSLRASEQSPKQRLPLEAPANDNCEKNLI